MRSMFKRALLTCVLAGVGFSACAQVMGSPSPMEGPPHEGMHRPDPAKMQAMVTKHLTALKAKLKITADQESAWSSFSAAMLPPTAEPSQRPNWEEIQKLPAPERIDKMRALRSLHQTE